MFNRRKQKSSGGLTLYDGSVLNLDTKPQRLYNRTGGVTGDFVYEPAKVTDPVRQGELGPRISYKKGEYNGLSLPSEDFSLDDPILEKKVFIATLRGYPAGIDALKKPLAYLYNSGYWGPGCEFQRTNVITAVVFTDGYGGCGTVNGNDIWISVQYSFAFLVEVIAHECYHNNGKTGSEEDHAWIYATTPGIRDDAIARGHY